jgi:hypothetical protein
MNKIPVFDGRPPRRDEGITSASSHPELVTGDFATPPQRYLSLTAMQRTVVHDRHRAIGGTFAIAAIAVLLSMTALFKSSATADGGGAEQQKFARACMQWHLAAGAVVSRLVQSTRDADLVRVGDAVFRMRRARRNCDSGWITLACQDYHSVAAGTPGYTMANDLFPCSRVAVVSDNRN